MLRFFRSSDNIVIVVILLIGVLTWLHVFGATQTVHSEIYGTFMFLALNVNMSAMLQILLGLILFLFTAILMIFVNNRLHLIDKISYLPSLCYVMLVGGALDIHLFNPVIIATILLIIAFIILVGSFASERLSYKYFTVSALISFATFFYQYMYVYMLVVWLVIALWRPGYWREWVFSILGFALPLFFAFSWFFLIDDDYTRMGVFLKEIFNIQRVAISLSSNTIAFFALSIVLFIITFGYTFRYVGSKKIAIRTGYYVMILIVAITVGMAFIVPDMIPMAWYLLAFPMSFSISYYLATIKSNFWGTIVLVAFFIGVTVAQAIFLAIR